MIYLRHLVRTSGPSAPATVALVAGTDAWIEPQVSKELTELFPSARRVAPAEAELVVVATLARSLSETATKVRPAPRMRTAVWLYAVDEGRVDALANWHDLRSWRRRRTLGSRLELWARAHPARWRLIGPAAQRIQGIGGHLRFGGMPR